MNKMIFALCLGSLLLLAGCAQEEPAQPVQPQEEPDQPMPGSDRDEHGCIPSAGYSWCESKQMCIRPWETPCPELTEAQARAIAEASECMEEGGLTGESMYNENSKTWWFDMDVEKEGCAPACVVDEETRTAEINWRCMGLLEPDESQECAYAATGASLTLAEARAIAEATGSVCMVEGTLNMNEASCNEGTGTWWITLVPSVEREGCNPACVVNVNSRTAEVNYRCTGLVTNAEARPPINTGGDACISAINGKSVSLVRAVEVATRNNSVCMSVGKLDATKRICDSATGLWWMRLNPTPDLETEGCSAFCVLNVHSETVEVRWDCGTEEAAEE